MLLCGFHCLSKAKVSDPTKKNRWILVLFPFWLKPSTFWLLGEVFVFDALFCLCIQLFTNGLHYAKRSLLATIWISVWPDQWNWLVSIVWNYHGSVSMLWFHTTDCVGPFQWSAVTRTCPHPSFGMTPTQAIGDLFAWRRPVIHKYSQYRGNVFPWSRSNSQTNIHSLSNINCTPQKPPSDSESLQNFMIWKFFSMNSEVTSEVFPDFLHMVKFASGWYFVHYN